MREVKLARLGPETLVLSIGTNKRRTRFFMNEDQAQQLSNRLQAFAKGGCGFETVLREGES